MNNKLSWTEIQRLYDQEWVQLTDYEWPEGSPFPSSGVVRVHASDRKIFYQKVKEASPRPSDSAFVFVGSPKREPGTVHTNFHRITS